MSEILLFDTLANLRLLARADVRCTSDGRRLSGVIDAQLEAIRLRLLDILERVQDGLPLSPEEEAHVHIAQATCRGNALLVRSLRRQLEREH